LSSDSSESSEVGSNVWGVHYDDEDKNFILDDASGSSCSESKTDELKAVHELDKMGISMELIVQAIDEIISNDDEALLAHICSKGVE